LNLTTQDLRRDVRTVLEESELADELYDPDTSFERLVDGREFTREGDPSVLEATVSPLDARTTDTEREESVLLIQDVSERADREAKLQMQNEQLQLLNRIVHHDIRNDMNLILELLRTMESGADGHTADTQRATERDRLGTIVDSGKHVVELTETAHTLTSAIAEATEERKPISIAPAVRREVANASTRSADATVRIEGAVPDVEVLANEMLGAVVRNLLTNAIQHNDSDQPKVSLSVDKNDEEVQVSVADNGPGLPTSARETLLGHRSARSSGIGLSLVKTLVEQYGGTVDVMSNEPRGTVICVTLERAR
jgi:signal transduction histidine kinase